MSSSLCWSISLFNALTDDICKFNLSVTLTAYHLLSYVFNLHLCVYLYLLMNYGYLINEKSDGRFHLRVVGFSLY